MWILTETVFSDGPRIQASCSGDGAVEEQRNCETCIRINYW